MLPSEWADEYRRLSPESSAAPGKWDTDQAPYQREMHNAMLEPGVERIVLMTAAQIGKTELVNNVVGYHIHLDPGPMLVVQPTLEMARTWARDRLEPMTRDTPVLTARVARGRTEEGRSTNTAKSFPGGHLTVVGANSPAGLASRPIRFVLLDEVDRFPASAGKEGDPVKLAGNRTQTFMNRRILMVSTPTIEGFSRIKDEFDLSDRRAYHVPCPSCGHKQPLEWEQVRWEGGDPENPKGDSSEVWIECEANGCVIEEGQKRYLLENGEWVAENPAAPVVGFRLNSLYSPWARWSEIVQEFIEAGPDHAKRQVWTNLRLGRTYSDGTRVEASTLRERAEDYTEAPAEVRYVTAAVDVQADRLEVLIVGWGVAEESWALEHRIIHGDPVDSKLPWDQLDELRRKPIVNELGQELRIGAVAVDSGAWTDVVYAYCRPRYSQQVYATKGRGGIDLPIVYKRSKRRKEPVRCPVFTIGADSAKDLIFKRLALADHGPGFIHFAEHFDDEFFAQVTSEVRRAEYRGGKVVVHFVKIRERNEALDLLVMNLAAVRMSGVPLVGPIVSRPDPKPKVEKREPPNKEPVEASVEAPPKKAKTVVREQDTPVVVPGGRLPSQVIRRKWRR